MIPDMWNVDRKKLKGPMRIKVTQKHHGQKILKVLMLGFWVKLLTFAPTVKTNKTQGLRWVNIASFLCREFFV